MANIHRPIKIFNGSGWDYIYPSVCRSISFDRTTTQVMSGNSGTVAFNSISSKGDSYTQIGALSSGNIKINMAGRYLLIYDIQYSEHSSAHPNGIREEIRKNGTTIAIIISGGRWSTSANGKHAMVFNFSTNDIISITFNVDGGIYDVTGATITLVYFGPQ